jgi:heme/copper-type cytochrome/quinol oxidase subunit 1
MPRLSRWFIRSALVYLALGFTLGALMLSNKGAPLSPLLWQLLPAHIECLVVGWTVQLMMGVAFWILPRFQGQRGNETPAWVAFCLLNLGALLAGFGPTLALSGWVMTAGRAAEAAAVAAFAVHAWPRIKPAGA